MFHEIARQENKSAYAWFIGLLQRQDSFIVNQVSYIFMCIYNVNFFRRVVLLVSWQLFVLLYRIWMDASCIIIFPS